MRLSKILQLIKNKEIKNAGWIIGERIVQMILSFVVGILSARYLGPENYGSLNYTASFITFFSSVATLGMEGVIIKKMIAQPEKEGSYLGGSIILRLISSMISSVAVVMIVAIFNPGDSEKIVLVLLQSIQLLFQAFYIFDSWFQRYLKSKYISIAKILATVVVMAYKLYLLATGKSVVYFAFSNSLSYIIIAIVLFIFFKKSQGPSLKWDIKSGIFVLKDSYHYILSGLMVSMYGQIDKIMIGNMISDKAVGIYTTGIAICTMWIFVPTSIINSFRPTILTLHQSGKMELYNRRLRQLYSFIIWLCIGVSVMISLLAPVIVPVLYGKEFIEAVNVLKIAIWCETFSMIGTARGIWVLAEEKNKYVKYYLAIGVAANLVLNATMIPLWGIEGAAVATLLTQITTSMIAPLCFKATREHTKIVLEAFCLSWLKKK